MASEKNKFNTRIHCAGVPYLTAHRESWGRNILLHFEIAGRSPEEVMIAQPAPLTLHPGGLGVEPFTSIPYETAQGLIDSLWQCGLRPSEGSGSAGQLKSVQYHLEDMRKLVFKESEKQK